MRRETTVERVGPYRVIRKLATGGTSDVLLAKAEGPRGFERTVVLKLLLSQFQNDEDLAQMFACEASAYARLAHPAIVRLFDFFAVPDDAGSKGHAGQLCMVLEHIDGPPLSRLRSMLKAAGKELDDSAAIYIGARVFDALSAAHAALDDTGMIAPVIHRDVNPSNVLVPWDGQVKLADFGVAKVSGVNHQSVAGMIKGTYGYMAPEQVVGDAVTPRADVYAAGILLWELLTKRRAFHRGALPEVEALRAMAEPRLVPLDTLRPDIDRAIREALARALEPRAERRTITAEEMLTILRETVPLEQGREQLVSALAAVRQDPHAAALSVPPSAVPSLTPRPPLSGVPRPSPVVSKHPMIREQVTVPARPVTPAGALVVKAAIDEVLRGQPSSMPPDILRSDRPAGTAVMPPPAPLRQLPNLGEATGEETSTLVLQRGESGDATGTVTAASPVSADAGDPPVFADALRELERAEALTVQPPAADVPHTSRLLVHSGPTPQVHTMPLTARPESARPPFAGPPPIAPPLLSASDSTSVSASIPPPRSGARIAAVVIILLVGAMAGATSLVGYLRYKRTPAATVTETTSSAPSAAPAPSAAAPVESAAAPVESAPPPASAAVPAPAASSASAVPVAPAPEGSADVAPGMGILKTTGAVSGRRIFVDDRTLGQTPESVTVPCGPRTVRLGSAGKPQKVEVPCGGTITVGGN